MSLHNDIIVAPATPTGGAIAIIRSSGEGSILLCNSIFRGRKELATAESHTIHYGEIFDGDRVIDDVVVSLFRAPHSYTGEESVEISCHGSAYIIREIMALLLKNGARAAEPGEYTIRAYLSGRLDLSQAEAVGDIIASESKAQLALATTQFRGGYSSKLNTLREEVISLLALMELELDFGEEDVEFAERDKVEQALKALLQQVNQLAESFKLGNAIKEGVNVAIVGRPNAGKSTLLNRLLCEERAMVSDIAGTTRDLIEEQINIDGITFRFIDTAGLHSTKDKLEQMGIELTHKAITRARIIIQLVDLNDIVNFTPLEVSEDQQLIIAINKIDSSSATPLLPNVAHGTPCCLISAKEGHGIEELLTTLGSLVDTSALYAGEPTVSSSRHYDLLCLSGESLLCALDALHSGISTELLCEDIRDTLGSIGQITGGSVDPTDILKHIFSNFCIGK